MSGANYKTYSNEELPDGLIGLETQQGQDFVNQASVINKKMIEDFKKQQNRTYCGPAALSLLMNSLNLGYHVKFQSVQRYSAEEEDLIEKMGKGLATVTEDEVVNAPKAQEFIKSTNLTNNGLTLSELHTLTELCGLGVSTYFAYSDELKLTDIKRNELLGQEKKWQVYVLRSADEFRDMAKSFIGHPLTGLIANYDMEVLKYEIPFGHFSPLAAYHEGADRFLIMNMWPDTPAVWVSTAELFDALATVDDICGLPRGLLHIYELV